MARPLYPRSDDPLPPPLPPAERTVGQLVAETIRLYGRGFWRALPLGLPVSLVTQVNLGREIGVQVLVLMAAAPLFTAAYVAASGQAAGVRPAPRTELRALAVGVLVFLPAPLLLRLFILPAVAWLALVGLAVPALVVERIGARAALRRAVALARADYVHAVGSLATLLLLFVLTRLMLAILLRSQSETTDRIAAFAADLVLSPILYLGAALLYYDQAARLIDSASPKRPRRRTRDADLHPADDADRAGGADAEVEPGPAARGQR
jgi:hypothetical protein